MDKLARKNLLKRHDDLKRLGKVTEAVKASSFCHRTYTRAINNEKGVRAETITLILDAQQRVLEKTERRLQEA